MNFLVGEKGYFSNSFSKLELTWQLTSNDAFIRQTSLHTSISVGGLRKSQWDVSANLSEARWFLEKAKKALFICAACCQTDAYPMCNKSTWYKRSTGNCFSTMIFKVYFFYTSSLEPVWLLSALCCHAPLRLCPLFVVSCAPAVCVFGDLVPYDKMAHSRRSTAYPPSELWSIIQLPLIHQLMDQIQIHSQIPQKYLFL